MSPMRSASGTRRLLLSFLLFLFLNSACTSGTGSWIESEESWMGVRAIASCHLINVGYSLQLIIHATTPQIRSSLVSLRNKSAQKFIMNHDNCYVDIPQNRGNRKIHKWLFKSTSTTIARVWSSWLVHRSTEAVGIAPKGIDKVFLDIPDETFMEFLPRFDVLVLSSGHWFAKRSAYIQNGNVVGGQLWWPHQAGKMQINNIDAFGVSVETCLTAVATNPNFTGLAIVRSYSPDHYEGGTWNTGGSCTGKVRPLGEVVRNGFTDVMHEKQVTSFTKVVKNAGKHGSRLKLMDITEPFAFRADGHPGPYRSPDPNKKTQRGPDGKPPPQDCLHWCMPGPVDTWNEMLLEIIRIEFEKDKS